MLSAIKLLYLNPAGALGGAERVLLDSARIVQARRPDWRLELIASSQGGLVEEAQACGIANSVLRFPSMIAGLSETRKTMAELGRVGLALPAILEYSRALSAELVRRAPNLIHANGLKMQVLGAHALPEQCKLIWHLHDYVRSRPLMKRLLRRYAPRCNAIIAVSHSVAADIAQVLHGVTPIYTVHNGVALDEFSPDGMCVDLDGLSGLSPPGSEVVRVGLVATGAWWKGHEVFLRALASLPQNAPVRGYVIGGPIYETEASQFSLAELRAMAMRYGVTARTGFTGYLAKVAPALRALDLVIHASVAPEPFGLVLAEAMACGRPVISSALGGAAELVENGRNAVTYRSDDPEELSAVILRLASNRELRARLGAEARASAVQRFDRERMGAQIVSIYEAALMAPARGGDAHPARA
jgi:glycosyltransferase involved in cell wall biosynthesis